MEGLVWLLQYPVRFQDKHINNIHFIGFWIKLTFVFYP